MDKIDNLSELQLTQRVLIPRSTGLEDCFRYYSVAMTLEYLVIANHAIAGAIKMLAINQIPCESISTANVKPSGDKNGLQQRDEFAAHLPEITASIEQIKHLALQSKTKYSHLWFGPFNAKQWQWLLSAHTNIHLKQIKSIKMLMK